MQRDTQKLRDDFLDSRVRLADRERKGALRVPVLPRQRSQALVSLLNLGLDVCRVHVILRIILSPLQVISGI